MRVPPHTVSTAIDSAHTAAQRACAVFALGGVCYWLGLRIQVPTFAAGRGVATKGNDALHVHRFRPRSQMGAQERHGVVPDACRS